MELQRDAKTIECEATVSETPVGAEFARIRVDESPEVLDLRNDDRHLHECPGCAARIAAMRERDAMVSGGSATRCTHRTASMAPEVNAGEIGSESGAADPMDDDDGREADLLACLAEAHNPQDDRRGEVAPVRDPLFVDGRDDVNDPAPAPAAGAPTTLPDDDRLDAD